MGIIEGLKREAVEAWHGLTTTGDAMSYEEPSAEAGETDPPDKDWAWSDSSAGAMAAIDSTR